MTLCGENGGKDPPFGSREAHQNTGSWVLCPSCRGFCGGTPTSVCKTIPHKGKICTRLLRLDTTLPLFWEQERLLSLLSRKKPYPIACKQISSHTKSRLCLKRKRRRWISTCSGQPVATKSTVSQHDAFEGDGETVTGSFHVPYSGLLLRFDGVIRGAVVRVYQKAGLSFIGVFRRMVCESGRAPAVLLF